MVLDIHVVDTSIGVDTVLFLVMNMDVTYYLFSCPSQPFNTITYSILPDCYALSKNFFAMDTNIAGQTNVATNL